MPDKELSAYDKHWARLAQLLGPAEAAAERARMTADEKADRLRVRVGRFKKELPRLHEQMAREQGQRRYEAAHQTRQKIEHREQVIADYEASHA